MRQRLSKFIGGGPRFERAFGMRYRSVLGLRCCRPCQGVDGAYLLGLSNRPEQGGAIVEVGRQFGLDLLTGLRGQFPDARTKVLMDEFVGGFGQTLLGLGVGGFFDHDATRQ